MSLIEKINRRIFKRVSPFKRRVLPPQPSDVDFGDFLSPDPISNLFGFDRGTPIDRYYIELFLDSYKTDIRGVCLEVAEDIYTMRFGEDRVERSDTLHATGVEKNCTIVGDLTDLNEVKDGTYDCIVLTQVLQFIFDIPAAVREIHRILKPGGVCLATGGGIAQISRYDMDRWGEYWRFTDLGARRLFEANFDSKDIEVVTYGNTGSAVAFLEGLTVEELSPEFLNAHNPDYQVVIGICARKTH